MQNRRIIKPMDSSGGRPNLSAEEIALLEQMVDDNFVRATVSVQDMRVAITDYAYRKWQA